MGWDMYMGLHGMEFREAQVVVKLEREVTVIEDNADGEHETIDVNTKYKVEDLHYPCGLSYGEA